MSQTTSGARAPIEVPNITGDILLEAGFKQVTSMNNGLKEWRSKGYPIEP